VTTEKSRPSEHNRRPTVDKNGRAVKGSIVNPGVEKKRRLMSQRERELYASQSESLKNLSEDVKPSSPITEKIRKRSQPISPDDLLTLEDLGNLEGFQEPNAIWHNKDSEVPVRVTRILDEKGPKGERYVRIAGSNTALPLDEISFDEPEKDETSLISDDTDTSINIDMEDSSLGPDKPMPWDPPQREALSSFDRLKREVSRPSLLKYAPRIAASFGSSLVAFNATKIVLDTVSPTSWSSAVAMLAISGGALVPEMIRQRKPKLSPEWQDFQKASRWNKRQCERWEKSGFSPVEAAAWDQVFASRVGLVPQKYPRGGSSAEPKLAAAYKKIFDVPGGVTVELAAPYIRAWMTPQDVMTWQKYGVSSDESMRAAVTLHSAASLEKGSGRVPAHRLVKNFFRSRGLPVPKSSRKNIVYSDDPSLKQEFSS